MIRSNSPGRSFATRTGNTYPAATLVKKKNLNTPSDFIRDIETTKMAFMILLISASAATYLFLHFLLIFTQDAREPQVLVSVIPFLSPLFGMRKKTKFYIGLRYAENAGPSCPESVYRLLICC